MLPWPPRPGGLVRQLHLPATGIGTVPGVAVEVADGPVLRAGAEHHLRLERGAEIRGVALDHRLVGGRERGLGGGGDDGGGGSSNRVGRAACFVGGGTRTAAGGERRRNREDGEHAHPHAGSPGKAGRLSVAEATRIATQMKRNWNGRRTHDTICSGTVRSRQSQVM